MTFRVSSYFPEGFLLFAVAFGPLAFGAVEPWSLAILSIIVSLAVLFSSLQGLSVTNQLLLQTLLPSVGILMLIGLVQRLNPAWIVDPTSMMPSTSNAYATGRALSMWVLYASILWCAPGILRGASAIYRLLALIFGLGIFVSIVGIIQISQNRLYLYGLRAVPYGYEPFGPYYNRDHAASLLVMAAFCGIGILWNRAVSYQAEKKSNASEYAGVQILIIFGIALCLLGVLFSLSRGALLAFLVTSGGMFFLLGSKKKLVVPFAAGLFVAAFCVYSSPIAERLSGEYIGSGFLFRYALYAQGLRLFQDYPWFGVGLGSFQHAFYGYEPQIVRGVVDHIHSDWLELLIETGVIGFSICLAGGILFLRAIRKGIQLSGNPMNRGMVYGIGGALTVFILHCLVEFSFQIPANAVIFFVLIAALSSLAEPKQSLAASNRIAARKGVNILVTSLVFIVSAVLVRPAIASWIHWEAKNGKSNPTRESLLQSHKWDAGPRFRDQLVRLDASNAGRAASSLAEKRQALDSAIAAAESDPANPTYIYFQRAGLRALGRLSDEMTLGGTKQPIWLE